MIKSLIATALLSFSVGSKSIDHRQAIDYVDKTYINGNYNLKSTFEFDGELSDIGVSVVFEDISDTRHYLNSIYCSNFANHFYYLSSIDFSFGYDLDCEITFNIYDVYSTTSFNLSIDNGDVLSDVASSYRDLIFDFRNTYVINGIESNVFNVFFTTEDNLYTTTYNGYYALGNNVSTMSTPVFAVGSMAFDNKLWTGMTTCSDGVMGGNNYSFLMQYYDFERDEYYMSVYTVPLNKDVISSNNILMSNVKMTKTTYNNLANVGIFAYERDTSHDDDDWQDYCKLF